MIKSIITNNKLLIVQSCPTLCNPMDWSLPGSSVHGIFQARILKRVVIPFSRGSFQPRDQTRVSCIAGRFFTTWATRKNHQTNKDLWKSHQMSKKKIMSSYFWQNPDWVESLTQMRRWHIESQAHGPHTFFLMTN